MNVHCSNWIIKKYWIHRISNTSIYGLSTLYRLLQWSCYQLGKSHSFFTRDRHDSSNIDHCVSVLSIGYWIYARSHPICYLWCVFCCCFEPRGVGMGDRSNVNRTNIFIVVPRGKVSQDGQLQKKKCWKPRNISCPGEPSAIRGQVNSTAQKTRCRKYLSKQKSVCTDVWEQRTKNVW